MAVILHCWSLALVMTFFNMLQHVHLRFHHGDHVTFPVYSPKLGLRKASNAHAPPALSLINI